MSKTVRLDFLEGAKLFDLLKIPGIDPNINKILKKIIDGKIN